MTASDRPTSGAPEGLDDMCPNCVTPWKCNGPHDPAPAAPVVSSEGEATLPLARIIVRSSLGKSLALYAENCESLAWTDALEAAGEILNSDWLAAALATARAEGAREVRDGIQDIIDARCAGDFSPLLPKLRAVLIAEESR